MEPKYQTCRRLHEEHEAVFGLLRRLRRALVEARGDAVPDLAATAWSALLRDVRDGLEGEVTRHFEFEERALFPLLAEAGESDLVDLFTEDHAAVRGIAAPLLELLAAAQARGLDRAGWQSARRLGLELCDALTGHAEREEQALLPALEIALSEDQDRELFAAYAGGDAITQETPPWSTR
jgi:hemerythrin-like domain-containing protein